MTRNPLVHALVAAGLLAAAGAGAAGLKKVQSASGAETVVAAANVPAAVAPVPPGATPNYRAIVQQAGPAVVGVTVEGTEKVAGGMPGLPPGMENAPAPPPPAPPPPAPPPPAPPAPPPPAAAP